MGESVRTFGKRFREHLKALSPIYDYYNTTGHTNVLDNFSLVGREDHNLMRLIKEAIYIRVNNPFLNRNIGKYHLSHIWHEVLINITELKINNQHIDLWVFHLPHWQEHLPYKNIPSYVAIPSATVATTSATTQCGYSTSHNCQSTSAIHYSGFPSATLAITSAN